MAYKYQGFGAGPTPPKTIGWLWGFLYGSVVMYLASGLVVTASMVANTRGDCPWWLPPYWTLTWLYQVAQAAISGFSRAHS